MLHALVDLDLHFVDASIFFTGEHGFGEAFIGVEHGVDGLMNGTLGQAAHPQQTLLQFFEIMFPMAFHSSSIPLQRNNYPGASAGRKRCGATRRFTRNGR